MANLLRTVAEYPLVVLHSGPDTRLAAPFLSSADNQQGVHQLWRAEAAASHEPSDPS